MTTSIVTRMIKDGSGALIARQCLDVSGIGIGPYIALQAIANAAGTSIVDIEALLTGKATETTLAAVLARLVAGITLASGSAVIGKVGVQVGGSDVSASNAVFVSGAQVSTFAATIAATGSLSGLVDLGVYRLARIVMPSVWTAAVITFQTSPDGTNWNDLYDASGAEYVVQAAASRSIIIPYADFLGTRYLKIRSGTSAAAVAQSAGAAFTLVGVP